MSGSDFELRPGERVRASDTDADQSAARAFRDVMGRFPTGVTVVTSTSEGLPVGFTCQAFASLSLDPPLVMVAPARTSRTWPSIERTGRFAVNVLAAGQEELSRRMAMRGVDKFAGVDWRPSAVHGSPLLAGAVAWVDCTVRDVHEAGDHLVVVGHVDDHGTGDAVPLLYHRGGYAPMPRVHGRTTPGETDETG